jgi:hypothetical protein
MYKKLLTAIGATIASAVAIAPAVAECGCGWGFPVGAFRCGFSCGFPWMGGLSVGCGLFGFGIPFWW